MFDDRRSTGNINGVVEDRITEQDDVTVCVRSSFLHIDSRNRAAARDSVVKSRVIGRSG